VPLCDGRPENPAGMPLPLILVSACHRDLGDHPYHVAGRKYVEAARLAGGLPLVVPRLEPDEIDAALALADGVLLTGSPSNVHPSHFEQAVDDPALPLDPQRDAWTLPLARRALALGVPLLGICRGAQEVNVALGGSLHQAVHAQPGLADHRADDDLPAAEQYAPVHPVQVRPGGRLAAILVPAQTSSPAAHHAPIAPSQPAVSGSAGADGLLTLQVNSLHGQGIDRLAPGLQIEALAPDGLIEAFSLPGAAGFNLCVQWHPEWRAADDPVSRALFSAFGAAVRERWCLRAPAPAVAGHAHAPDEPGPPA
jgi:putative glutamine amidotransferase